MDNLPNKNQVLWGNFTVAAIGFITAIYFPVFVWMHERFHAFDTYYSHGILIPWVTLGLIYRKRKQLLALPAKQNNWGLFLILFSLLLHLGCTLVRVYFMSGFSLILLIYGVVLFLYGSEVTRRIIFPLSFLVFMVPLPLVAVNTITVPLKVMVTNIVVAVLQIVIRGPVSHQGFQIFLPHASLVVENPCSGLRSIIVMVALGSLFAYFLETRFLKRAGFLLLSVPVALIANIIRVLILSLSVHIYGRAFTDHYVHDASGYLMFATAFIGLWFLWRVFQWGNSK